MRHDEKKRITHVSHLHRAYTGCPRAFMSFHMSEYTKEEFYEDIDLPGEVRALCPDVAGYGNFVSGFLDPERARNAYEELSGVIGSDPAGFTMLAVQLEAARACRNLYDRAGIPRSVYVPTMRCFSRFLEEAKKRRGTYVFDRGRWTYRHTSMTIFRVGELEYEFLQKDVNDCTDGFGIGNRVIEIHVQSEADINADKVKSSVEGCELFCRHFFPGFVDAARECTSWLMLPRLKSLLDPTSRILKFQTLFDVTDLPDDTDFYVWLFGVAPGTSVSRLRRDTSLQKGVVSLLEKGVNLGAGKGILRSCR